ncbi:hypothetical protein NPIL_269771 [Nephila pilipes]|uniref:Uncharacterized protein n=1 Tax=Nephila pilipes TaxID=299642 RepID=A0A8X6UFT0_NEPPI|nr:hypothetical protein NPIL_269771 [Nephila pilipes]
MRRSLVKAKKSRFLALGGYFRREGVHFRFPGTFESGPSPEIAPFFPFSRQGPSCAFLEIRSFRYSESDVSAAGLVSCPGYTASRVWGYLLPQTSFGVYESPAF